MAVANSPTRTTPSDASTLAGVSHRRGTIAPLLQTHSQRYRDALARLERLAKHDGVQVLIFGETGTGKSIFAQHLHNSSPRRDRIFQHVVLSSMNDALAPSDLFGHLPGSFSGARERRHGRFVSANGGTLFLDEIGKALPAYSRIFSTRSRGMRSGPSGRTAASAWTSGSSPRPTYRFMNWLMRESSSPTW